MGKLKTLMTFFFLITLISCEQNDEIEINPNNLLIGNWKNIKYDQEKIILERINNLKNNASGFSFKENRNFIERSSGFCGTPPLVFSDIKGTWKLEENLISITKESYPQKISWRIISLTENEMIVTKELTDQEIDHQKLMDLFNDFQKMLGNNSCTNNNDWSYTGYGSKACGGFQGYIAYSNNIDTVSFLEKIEIYTKAEEVYNKKWSIFSTCDVISEPISIACINGYPVLKY